MPMQPASSNAKASRMCSTLNHFYNKTAYDKTKPRQPKKALVYSHDNDYTSNDKVVVSRKKKLKKVKNQFLITSHPYMQDRASFQSRCGSDLKFNWKSGFK